MVAPLHPGATPASPQCTKATSLFPLHTPSPLTQAKSGCPTLQAHMPDIVMRLFPTHSLLTSFVAFHTFPFILMHSHANPTPQPPVMSPPFVTRAEYHLNQPLTPCKYCTSPSHVRVSSLHIFTYVDICRYGLSRCSQPRKLVPTTSHPRVMILPPPKLMPALSSCP